MDRWNQRVVKREQCCAYKYERRFGVQIQENCAHTNTREVCVQKQKNNAHTNMREDLFTIQ